jgi:hypothetical protein
VCAAVGFALLYRRVDREGLVRPVLLSGLGTWPFPCGHDAILSCAMVDLDMSGRPVLVLGTFGGKVLVYQLAIEGSRGSVGGEVWKGWGRGEGGGRGGDGAGAGEGMEGEGGDGERGDGGVVEQVLGSSHLVGHVRAIADRAERESSIVPLPAQHSAISGAIPEAALAPEPLAMSVTSLETSALPIKSLESPVIPITSPNPNPQPQPQPQPQPRGT